jgi:putative transposase
VERTLHLLMSDYRRANTKGGTYFFTVVTYRRQRFLCDEMVQAALRDGIKATRAKHPFTIDAWVLLPDHLHSTAWMQEVEQRMELLPSIWTLPPDDADFGIRWR